MTEPIAWLNAQPADSGTPATAIIDPRLSPTGPQPSLSGLPAEVFLHIIKFFNEKQPLLSLCRVNRRLNYLVTPVLYEKFDTSFGNECLFLRTIAAVPQLASHVKHLRWIDGQETWDSDNADYEAENRRTIASTLRELPTLFHKQLSIACEHGLGGTLHGSLRAAAMSLTPNLESIEATLCTSQSARIRWNDIVWHGSTHGFEHLHTITITVRRSSNMDLNALFLLPSVRVLDVSKIDRVSADSSNTFWLPLPPESSNVEVLLLRDANVETNILLPSIKACRKLRTFLYHQHGSRTPIEMIDMEKLSSTLKVHRGTLENLAIMDRSDDNENSNCTGTFEDIMEFEELQTMLLPFAKPPSGSRSILALPPKATWFAQSVRGPDAGKSFDEFLALCSRSGAQLGRDNPHLRSISVWKANPSTTKSMVSYMARQACKNAGIQLGIHALQGEENVNEAIKAWESSFSDS